MKSDIVLKKGKDILVATLRDIIPEYSQQGHLWEELVSHIEKHGAKILSPCMVIYHEEGYKESEVDAEVIEPIDKEIPATDRIEVKKLIPYENLATIVHKGSYQNLYMSYGEIMKWIKRNDYEIIDSSRELYIKGEWNSDSIDEYVTEIQIPVKKK
jgi:effector-binding domain-containing protein